MGTATIGTFTQPLLDLFAGAQLLRFIEKQYFKPGGLTRIALAPLYVVMVIV